MEQLFLHPSICQIESIQSKIIDVFIYDLKGSLIKSLTLNQSTIVNEISTSNLINGMYVLKVNKNGKEIGSEQFTINTK